MSIFRRFGLLACLLLFAAVGCSNEIKIGAVISETGAVGPYGEKVKNGIELALEEINAAGGINGGVVQVVFEDDASSPDKGLEATIRLIDEEGVRVILGAVGSSVTMAVAPICEKKEVLLLSPSSSAPAITDAGDFIFRNYPSDILEGTAMADFSRNLGLKSIVVFSVDNEWGTGLTEVFTRRFESRTRKVVKSFSVPANPEDPEALADPAAFAAMVDEVKELDPHGIYIVAYLKEMSALLQQLESAGVAPVLMATASVNADLPRLAGSAAERVVYPQPAFDVNSTVSSVASFVSAYRAKFDADPDKFAAHGYDAMKLIGLAMTETASSHPDDVRQGLMRIDAHQGAAGRTSFDEFGDVVRYPRIFVIQDGQAITHEDFEKQGGQLPTPKRR